MTGNAFIWRAKSLIAINLMEQQRLGDALNRLDAVLNDMKSHFKADLHPAMEQTMTQMSGIAQRLKNYEKAIDTTGAIVQIRINEHGNDHDGVLVPLIKIATFQKILQQDDLMVETCRKGIEHATLCL